MDLPARGSSDRAGVRRALSRRSRVEGVGGSGLESAAARKACAGARRRANPQLEGPSVAGVKKKALNEGRLLLFLDESGLSQRPHRCRTWAPRGQTPVLQYNFNWKTLSVV